MANLDDYLAKQDAIQAIPDEKTQTPAMPVDVFLQEAEDLSHWCANDAAALATVGITQEKMDDLPVRTGALREAQSLWFKEFNTQEEAKREWDTLAPVAYVLRDELIHTFRFAFRADPVLLGRVTEIAEGASHADMLQDLNDLSVLGKANSRLLSGIGFDETKLDTAAQMSDDLAALLAAVNGDRAEQSESKRFRDKAYTYVKELVDEIRDAGKYLFWKSPERLKGYISRYRKLHRSDSENETAE